MTETANSQTLIKQDDDVQAINELVAEWLTAVRSRDIEKILTFITDDAVFLAPNASPIKGKQAFEAMYRDVFAHCDLDQIISYEEIQVVGDWAFAWGVDSITLIPLASGEPMKFKGHGMSILRRQRNGTWKFARGINNMSQESSAPSAASG